MEKGGELTEDELKKHKMKFKMTDKFIKEIDTLLSKKKRT